jgi:hypothetical protein
LLEGVPPGVTTWTVPVVAPTGTLMVIKESESTVNVAAVPLKVTLVAPTALNIGYNLHKWRQLACEVLR